VRNSVSVADAYSKEEYYYRAIFHEHFPDAAALCVPQEASVACSTKSH
jgi:asparagine synthase (glutamine-hydrolysing)